MGVRGAQGLKYSNYIFYLYVGQGHIAEQEARHQLTNFNPSVYNPSHDSQGIPQTEANIIEHDSTLGCWFNRLELNQLELSSMELQALYKSTQTTTSVHLGIKKSGRSGPLAHFLALLSLSRKIRKSASALLSSTYDKS